MTFGRWNVAVLVVAGLSGCAGLTKTGAGRTDDPLLGGPTAPPPSAIPMAINPLPGAGTLGQPTAQSQPLAQPTYASPAVLATGAYPPLTGGQDLRIGTAPANSGGNRILPKSQTPAGVMAVVTADPDYGKAAAAVNGVVPLDANGARATAGNIPAAIPTSAGGLEQALNQLNGFNPKWHRLESTSPGVWRFSCSVPDRAEPNKSRTYEAEGATPIAAVQQVLDRARQGP